MTDASKIQYYTGYNAYKNLQVHSGSINITGDTIASSVTRRWSTTVSVEPNSKFSSALIQVNRDNYPAGVTALRWMPFPSGNTVWQTLSLDPDGFITNPIWVYLKINNNQVTFEAQGYNGESGAIAYNPITIGFVYAVHTLAI